MNAQRKGKTLLLVACMALILGLFTLWQSHISWYGVEHVSGNQARAVGVLLILFSGGLFISYLRQ